VGSAALQWRARTVARTTKGVDVIDRKKLIAGAAATAAIIGLTGGAVALAGNGDDVEKVSGPDADKATAAALRATRGGHANAVERDTENGATWEVEVTKTDGKTVDVRLDDQLAVVVIEGDSEPPDETGS
jgi:hypothetical protein